MQLILGALTAATLAGVVKHRAKRSRRAREHQQRIRESANHNGKTFVNNVHTPTGVQGSAGGMLRQWLRGREQRVPERELPVHRLGAEAFAQAPDSGLRITWMGHASALVEIDGARILTDPVWSQRVSPVSHLGPARFHPAPIALAELPPLDAVVISHDHYDHLDRKTIVALAATGVHFIVPLGVGAHLQRWRIPAARITELDWWQQTTLDCGLTFVATPARHFSGRSVNDRNRTLWASWVIRGDRHRVYFGGDSGMFPGFAEIGEREGPFDATLMPIGAYNPAWQAVHLDPEEAVAAHQMVRGGLLVPIHWGTFNLAFHDWFEPVERLLSAARKNSVELALPQAGQPVEPAAAPVLNPWWRQYSSAPAPVDDAQVAPGSARL